MVTKIDPKIEDSWKNALSEAFTSDYFYKIKAFLMEERQKHQIYPSGSDIFKAFDCTPFESVRVVIIGQDPYHGPGQAHGLCFSVPDGVKHPPSLRNIFKELHSDIGMKIPESGNLTKWAHQGVFLINAILTVRKNQAGSHQNIGWEKFTNQAIKTLSDSKAGLVFLLWGNYAKAKRELIDIHKHFILEAPHPSPFSANSGFFGCKHFSKTNDILRKLGKAEINWELE